MRAGFALLGLLLASACLPLRDPAVSTYRCASGTSLYVRGMANGAGVSLFLEDREIPLPAVAAHRSGHYSNGQYSLWLAAGRATLESGGRPTHVDCRLRPNH